MIRRPFALAIALAATLIAVSSALSAPHAVPTVNGTVGPGFTITLKQNGKSVKTLKAGSYSFVIADKANIHNFVLEKKKGGTFEKELTEVPFTGTNVKPTSTPISEFDRQLYELVRTRDQLG